jgi:hypothetical protein
MYKTISNKIIRKFNPCYDPSDVIKDENEELTVKEWVQKYRKVIPAKDIVWLLLRKEFLSEKELRLFAVWCVRETLKLIENPDKRSVEACNVAERYANGEATKEELLSAYDAVNAISTDDAYIAADVAFDDKSEIALVAVRAASTAASYAAESAYCSYGANDVSYAAYSNSVAVYDATRSAQLDKLLNYF